ncbi:hypothetical protein JCGZ_23791 [Jatropha curcas]|uniref:Leucine-rich repeat-containing N-terminal plant-type domain-containing protein n=1 Tax=Jatropha curcas TaxID=180498 RepID=A0A067LFH4_JATCU|nr:hypothetical protein JCGZ_23791 [Jatropha curcas]
MGCLCFWSCFFIYASVCLLFFVTGTYSVPGNETDKQALLEFKAGIAADPFAVMTSWNGTIHFCQWYGVTCVQNKSLKTLSKMPLARKVPVELGYLSKLQYLVIDKNNLTGTIPHFLGNLSSFTALSLAFNNIVGNIPDALGQLKNFQYLEVFDNKLSGIIPPSIFNLSSITFLDIAFNHFEGFLPADLFTDRC